MTRGDSRRLTRVSEAIREELAQLLVKDVKDPKLNWVTITGVEASPDLRHARVYFTASGTEDKGSLEDALKRAASFLQRALGNRLKLKYTPKLSFHVDESFEKGERIDQLIREVNKEADLAGGAESEARELNRLIDGASNILVATHRNPDGDAIGSILGMSGILELLYKKHTVYCPDGIPNTLAFLPGAERVVGELDEVNEFDLTLLFDTGDESLLPDGFPDQEKRGTLVVVDHHAEHRDFGDLVIRREASAVGEIIFDLAVELVWPMDSTIAECFYTSIVADTGSFRYSSTSPKTHRAAAELLAAGARPWVVATHLFESFTLRRQRLMGEVLDTLVVSDDGRFAQLFSTPDMLIKVGATKEDLDGMINLGRSIDGVEIAAMFRIKADGDIKVSFRSKGRVDVGKLAAQFGGGGHRNAAGCTLQKVDLSQARQTIMKAAEEYLNQVSEAELSEEPT